ncbi:hypothetical protein Dform_00404 [Dehalogenimonas formicexedens]|uniref:Uncharacterized protein n=1 Tax=Dehalogenimonas formicexedens TaxID=1839801 RepID=A0A1P8F5Y8_9CHLR|nr:hypothetical protein [Dehalogenimonas formicexedens]APV43762.1 hypothetical protein Dform_00404 [Dehalogenimonas formicexedens]
MDKLAHLYNQEAGLLIGTYRSSMPDTDQTGAPSLSFPYFSRIAISAAGDLIRVRYGSFFKSNLTIAPKLIFGDSFRNKIFSGKTEKQKRLSFFPTRRRKDYSFSAQPDCPTRVLRAESGPAPHDSRGSEGTGIQHFVIPALTPYESGKAGIQVERGIGSIG